jgi:hypothetical protein
MGLTFLSANRAELLSLKPEARFNPVITGGVEVPNLRRRDGRGRSRSASRCIEADLSTR